jgi:hypothetical protein
MGHTLSEVIVGERQFGLLQHLLYLGIRHDSALSIRSSNSWMPACSAGAI